MVQAEEEARARGVSKFGLGVETDNEAALGLYRVLGYKDAGHGVFIESGQLADGTVFLLIETYLTKTLNPGLIGRQDGSSSFPQ